MGNHRLTPCEALCRYFQFSAAVIVLSFILYIILLYIWYERYTLHVLLFITTTTGLYRWEKQNSYIRDYTRFIYYNTAWFRQQVLILK